MRFILWIALFCTTCLHATITMYNDSAYPLVAKIYNAQGELMATISLSPGQTQRWDYEQSSYSKNYNTPYTPYTVRWYCNTDGRPFDYSTEKRKKGQQKPPEYESEYAVWQNVPTGASITAQGSPKGNHSCVIKKKKPDSSKSKNRQRKKQQQNSWENDGGENWGNDGPSPFQTQKKPQTPEPSSDGEFLNDGGQDWTNDGGNSFNQSDQDSSTGNNRDRWKND